MQYKRIDLVDAEKTGPVQLNGKHCIIQHITKSDNIYQIGCFVEMDTTGIRAGTGVTFYLGSNQLNPHILDLGEVRKGASNFRIIGNGEVLKVEFDTVEEMLVNYLYADILVTNLG